MASSDNQETAKKPLHVCGVVPRKRSDVPTFTCLTASAAMSAGRRTWPAELHVLGMLRDV